MKRQIHHPMLWFHPIQSFALTFGGIGLLIGLLVGLIVGSPQSGMAIGFLVGVIPGLLIGIRLASRMDMSLETPVTPPPGGWRSWDDDDDWDN